MRLTLFLVVLLCSQVFFSEANAAEKRKTCIAKSEKFNFSILMPCSPTLCELTPYSSLSFDSFGEAFKKGDRFEGELFYVEGIKLIKESIPKDVDAFLKKEANDLKKYFKATKITIEANLRDGMNGYKVLVDKNLYDPFCKEQSYVKAEIYYFKGSLYKVILHGTKKLIDSELSETYFNSFKLLHK